MPSQQNEKLYSNESIERYLESRRNASHNEGDHCLEYAGEVNGVTYLNDSRSTRVTRTKHSLESIDAPVILIVGGDDSENDYSVLSPMVRDKVKAVFYLGDDNDVILRHFIEDYMLFVKVYSLDEAVKYSGFYGRKGEVVLFSPACVEDRQFENYRDRGNAFKLFVNNLSYQYK